MMNILDVAKKTVKSFPNSYAGAGALLGISPNVLRNKVSKANETHHLTLHEAVELMREAEDENVADPHALLRELAASFGYALVRPGEGHGASDLSLAEKLIETNQRTAAYGLEVVKAISDGQVTESEMEAVSSLGRGATQSIVELEEMVRGFQSPAPVVPLRARQG